MTLFPVKINRCTFPVKMNICTYTIDLLLPNSVITSYALFHLI